MTGNYQATLVSPKWNKHHIPHTLRGKNYACEILYACLLFYVDLHILTAANKTRLPCICTEL